MAWIFWLSSQQALPPPPGISYTIAAIAGHFALYAILTLLMLVAVGLPRQPGDNRIWIAVGIALLYAASDELHQSFVSGRDASGFDLLVDTAGALFALTVWIIGWRKTVTN